MYTLVVILAVLGSSKGLAFEGRSSAGTCETPECGQTAASMLSFMNNSVDPCDDFFEYACGSLLKQPFADDNNILGVLADQTEAVMQKLKNALENDLHNDTVLRMTKMFYRSCMDTDQISKTQMIWLTEMIDSLGGWPVLGKNRNDEYTVSLEYTLGTLQVITSTSAIMNIGLFSIKDGETFSDNFIYISKPALTMTALTYYLEPCYENERKALVKYMTRVAVLLGAEPKKAEEDMLEVLQFEIRLAQSLHGSNGHAKRTLEQLENFIPKFNWTEYLQTALNYTPNEVMVSTWILYEIKYILETTDRRILQNYIIWKLYQTMDMYLLGEFRKERYLYEKTFYGIPVPEKARWRECVEITKFLLPNPTDELFVNDTSDVDQEIQEIFEDIKTAFSESLDTKTWMNESEQMQMKEKAKAMQCYTPYSEEIKKIYSGKLSKYNDLIISEDDYFENIKNLFQFELRENVANQPFFKSKWTLKATDVNIAYISVVNAINVAAGHLEPPIYNKKYTKSVNYGGIGFLIAHELTHAFGDIDRRRKGNIDYEYENPTQCLINQFSGIMINKIGLYLNGKRMIHETIADNGAMYLAYKAYKNWVDKHGKEELLPGLDLSHDQLFFLKFAQGYCDAFRPKLAVWININDSHPLHRVRVTNALRNSDDFAAAYKCPLGSPMNPAHKCRLW